MGMGWGRDLEKMGGPRPYTFVHRQTELKTLPCTRFENIVILDICGCFSNIHQPFND